MATVPGGQTHQRNGSHSRGEMNKMHNQERARDDLKGAYSGDENDGPFGDEKSHQHSTDLKGRKTEQSKEKTPKM